MGAKHHKPSAEELRYRPKSIQLLWVRGYAPRYRRLSLNIVREICAYFGRPVIFKVNHAVLGVTDITSREEICIHFRHKTSILSWARLVMLPTGKIFVCAAGDLSTCYVGNNAYIVDLKGDVWKQPDMLHVYQYTPGVVYYSQLDVVYVFGGRRSESHHLMKYCDMFSLSTHQWKRLPDMRHGRSLFTPCIYSGVIYLCGGFSEAVEVFDPKSNLCTVTNFILFPVAESITAAESGRIFTITHEFLYIIDLQQHHVTKVAHDYGRPWYAHSPAFVLDGVMYTGRPKFSMFKMPDRRKIPETLVAQPCCFFQAA